ncbi:helix-turn-helix domain-containing protein [Halosimplex sp. TS25]|uniref:helix-turn-helix domain-containing protein n=1 Tax=Halosimplex rarum TaxID=3396619 RepID=UPI0039EA3A50
MSDTRVRPVAATAVLAVVLASLLGTGPIGFAGGASVDTDRASGASPLVGPAASTAGTDVLGNLSETTTATPTPTATPSAGTNATPTPTPDGSLSDAISTATENTTETVSNTTDSVANTTEDTTDSTTETTDAVTNTTENATESTVETTENTTDSVTETTENTTEDLTDATEETVENTTDSVTNTTETVTNTTEDLTNATENGTSQIVDETDDLVDANLTATASVDGEATVGANATVGLDGSVGLGSAETSTTPATAVPSEPEPASATAASGQSTADSDAATTSGAPAANRGEGGTSGDSSLPASGGAAAGGALVVVGVTAAAASKHVAANTAAAQGSELTWLARATRLKAHGAVDALRGQLARLPRVIVPPGYSRHDDSDPLEHETRRDLFETVERSPGVNLSTLAEGCDASLSTVRHHLRILEEERLLVSERIRGQRRYFPGNESDPALLAALDDTATEPILRTLARSGPASVSDLADALGRDPSTISHHVSRLEDDGLVERERDGRSVQNSLAPAAERVLTQSGTVSGQQRPLATE